MAELMGIYTGITLTIDGVETVGRFEIERELIDVTTSTETRPAPSWTEVDAAGHFHAWGEHNALPTLTTVVVHADCDCLDDEPDEDCDNARVEHRCCICSAPVFPRWLVTHPPLGSRQIPGRTRYLATAQGNYAHGAKVSIVAADYFGVGSANTYSITSDGTAVTTFLCGPMAKRLIGGAA